MPMNEDNYNDQNQEEIFSKRIRAGKRTYFFDVKATRNNDYYITLTESKRSRFEDGSFVKTKIHLYKEDFNKFSEALNETISHVKSNLLPEYNFDEYSRNEEDHLDWLKSGWTKGHSSWEWPFFVYTYLFLLYDKENISLRDCFWLVEC